ncbi:MAG: DNA-directed RNA polymerase subunit omega [Deltaproteobacteria bacterium]|nr:DNA-directed RNA polymerase subunit omega [Deltaproteobacteria bacterium]
MARVTVEDCLEKVENRFALVILASKRTKELKRGAPVLVHDRDNREVVMSLREIARGLVKPKDPSREPGQKVPQPVVDVKSG